METLNWLRETFFLSQLQLVRLSGFSARSLVSWGKGSKPSRFAAVKFIELHRVFSALLDLFFSADNVSGWLEEPNAAFEGSTPLQVMERGEIDRLWRMVFKLKK